MPKQLDAQSAHGRLRRALTTLHKAECNAVTLFAEIMQRRFFRELGYASIHLYASEALGFSRSKTYEFIRLAESLDKLPRLKAGIESGEISWTKAREVVKVATPKTEERWLDMAVSKSRRELEKQVVASRAARDQASSDRAQGQGELLAPSATEEAMPRMPASALVPAASPVSALTLRLDPMQRVRFDAMIEKLMKRFRCGREEALLMAMETTLIGGEKSAQAGSAPSTRVDRSAPYQVLVHRCESCGNSAVGPEKRPLGAAETEQVACDSQVLESGRRNRRSIPPSRRRAVLLRDGHRCRVRGCGRVNFLEVHHLQARHKGGGNGEENLVTLCSSCHRHLHELGGDAVPLRKP